MSGKREVDGVMLLDQEYLGGQVWWCVPVDDRLTMDEAVMFLRTARLLVDNDSQANDVATPLDSSDSTAVDDEAVND